MATIDDILTTQKNGVVAINNLSQIFKSYNEGEATSQTVTSSTLITVGGGRLISVTVVIAGSADGFVYNASTIAGIDATNALCASPFAAVGTYTVGAKFTNGLVVEPGTGQSINVTYSLD